MMRYTNSHLLYFTLDKTKIFLDGPSMAPLHFDQGQVER